MERERVIEHIEMKNPLAFVPKDKKLNNVNQLIAKKT